MTRITWQEEIVLSYLTGLAPVGEVVVAPTWMVKDDLKFLHLPSLFRFYQMVRALIGMDAIERIGGVKDYQYRVKQRPEDFTVYSMGRSKVPPLIGEEKKMAAFEPGDIVRCLNNYPGQFTAGKLYTVRMYDDVTEVVGIALDDGGSTTNGWYSTYFVNISRGVGLQANANTSPTLVPMDPLPAAMRRLTKHGEQLKSEFDHLYAAEGCTCPKGGPGVCRHCSHPGHPYALDNNSAAWEEVPARTKQDDIMDAIREMAGKGNT